MISYKFLHSEISGVIFDLDGVITNTASLHEMAWKKAFYNKLKFFTNTKLTKTEYLDFLDGKPRLKGINDFLKYKKIKKTQILIESISTEKNKIFLNLIKDKKIKVFQDSLNLIKQIKKFNVKIAVASSSKNCRYILKKINLIDSFDFIIDGTDLETLKKKGKPSPDIFLIALKKLSLNKKQTIIIEDSSAGVVSAFKSGANFVIGIARSSNQDDLKNSGAKIVVNNLNNIKVI